MTASLVPPGAVEVPAVSQVEIEAFHAEHFSNAATQLFAADFLEPQPNHDDIYYEDYEGEDDGLGYYSDGVKRTLTDEQIAIFRHSEIEALRRAEEKALSKSDGRQETELDITAEDANSAAASTMEASELLQEGEDGEIESDTPQPNSTAPSRKKKKKKKSNKSRQLSDQAPDAPQRGEQGWFRKTVKPDLRKRTWDVVETGMDGLDYGDLDEAAGHGGAQTSQRRKISYDD